MRRLTAIKKIYKKYGMGTWTIHGVHRLWTKRERSLINMNFLKQRNMIEDCGWAPDNKVHLWKLSMSMVLMCTEEN